MSPRRAGLLVASICTPTLGTAIAIVILTKYIIPLNVVLTNGSGEVPPNYGALLILLGYGLTFLVSYFLARDIAMRKQK